LQPGQHRQDFLFREGVQQAGGHDGGFCPLVTLDLSFWDLGHFVGFKRIGGEEKVSASVVELGDDLSGELFAIVELNGVGLIVFSDGLGGFENGLKKVSGTEATGNLGQIGSYSEAHITVSMTTTTESFMKELFSGCGGFGESQFLGEIIHLPGFDELAVTQVGDGGQLWLGILIEEILEGVFFLISQGIDSILTDLLEESG